MLLDKQHNETEFQYHKRLVYGKLIDKSLSEYDYTTLSKYLYGKGYAPDVARRMFYGSCRTLKLVDESTLKNVSNEDVINEVDAKLHELKKETQKCSDQRRELNKLLSAEGRFEHLCDCLVESANNLNKTVPLKSNPVQVCKSNKEAVLFFSDWHYGMTTDNFVNVYNKDICQKRVSWIVNRAMEKIRLNGCQTLHIVVLGDLVHGAIHTSARVASEELVCDQLMQVSEILAQAILKLSECVIDTKVYITYGNHARVVPDKKDNVHRDNFERLVPWWIEQRLKINSNIKVVPDDGNEFVTVCAGNYGIVATHGDLDNMTTAEHTISPLFKEFFKNAYDVDLKAVVMGDKHHYETKGGFGVRPFICGSLCGTDDYANSKRLYSDASQLLLILDSDFGIDGEYVIEC